jgi:hypothetical protein
MFGAHKDTVQLQKEILERYASIGSGWMGVGAGVRLLYSFLYCFRVWLVRACLFKRELWPLALLCVVVDSVPVASSLPVLIFIGEKVWCEVVMHRLVLRMGLAIKDSLHDFQSGACLHHVGCLLEGIIKTDPRAFHVKGDSPKCLHTCLGKFD